LVEETFGERCSDRQCDHALQFSADAWHPYTNIEDLSRPDIHMISKQQFQKWEQGKFDSPQQAELNDADTMSGVTHLPG
jgi:hypothetical protein